MTDPVTPADQIEPAGKPGLRRAFAGGRRGAAPALSLVGLLVVGLLTAQLYMNWTPTLSPLPRRRRPLPRPFPFPWPAARPRRLPHGHAHHQSRDRRARHAGIREVGRPVGPERDDGSPAHRVGEWLAGVSAGLLAGRPVDLLRRYPDHDGQWYDPDSGGAITGYSLTYPVLCRVHPDGTGKKDVLSSLIRQGSLRTFFWIMEPSISPNGSTAAVASDGRLSRPSRT